MPMNLSEATTKTDLTIRHLSEGDKQVLAVHLAPLSTIPTPVIMDELSNRSEKEDLDFHKQLISQSHGKRVYRITVFVTEDEE